jgi:hypothetical protein
MEFDTRTLILAVHAVIAGVVFVYAGLTFANGGATAAGVRALLGTLVLALGVSLYRVRGKQR